MSCWECCTSMRMAKGARPGRSEKVVHRKRGRNGCGPRARRSEPGPRISWGCAGNRRRSRRGPRCRVRTGSGLCESRLSPHECAAPKGSAAETVTAGTARAAVVRDDGRVSGRPIGRGRPAPYARRRGRAIVSVEKSDETRRIASFRDNWPHGRMPWPERRPGPTVAIVHCAPGWCRPGEPTTLHGQRKTHHARIPPWELARPRIAEPQRPSSTGRCGDLPLSIADQADRRQISLSERMPCHA